MVRPYRPDEGMKADLMPSSFSDRYTPKVANAFWYAVNCITFVVRRINHAFQPAVCREADWSLVFRGRVIKGREANGRKWLFVFSGILSLLNLIVYWLGGFAAL